MSNKYGSIPSDHSGDVDGNTRILKETSSSISIRLEKELESVMPWEFPGWGTSFYVHPEEKEILDIEEHISMEHPKLSEWLATAICGNDILSSCLYVSGLVASKAGFLAPVALAFVAGVLYLYRFIYGEVVNAIPLNGGSYNVLLNTTTKRVASVAASLAILSYVATGVVSGVSACNYLQSQITSVAVVPATIVLLFFFAMLSLVGITESAVVALIIFIAHTVTLLLLCGMAIMYMVKNNYSILHENFHQEFPKINLAGTIISGDFFTALFFGTSSAMLGISGFESSSQFVEEQASGVFVKTLRNMWWSVAIFNPLISFLSLGVLPLYGPAGIIAHKDTVLAEVARVVGGTKMEAFVALDAFIVLSGAVLTAYVGVNGLVRRLASDRVLPTFLLHVNPWRQTNHIIIVGYFLIASSLVVLLNGNTETLSGVYTYAFLGLMTLFGSGCMLLKYKRPDIPRTITAPWWSCIIGVSMVVVTVLGNLLGDPTILTYFSLYFLSVLFVVYLMFERTFILRICLYCLRRMCPSQNRCSQQEQLIAGRADNVRTGARGGKTIARIIQDINDQAIFFFCKRPMMSVINKAILYVKTNEQTNTIYIVHCYPKDEQVSGEFADKVALFDHIFLKIKINFLAVEGPFGPAMVEWISRQYQQPKNMMFIKQPNHDFAHTVASLGGVRVITG